MFLFTAGCAGNKSKDNADYMALPPVASFADDIRDITLPPELEWIRDESMIIKTESFRGGVYRYSGRIEVLSLKDYLVASMQDNKWRLVGETASKDFMLAFVKPNKTCMMVVSEKAFGKVELTLYVTIDQALSNKVNAFGEAIGATDSLAPLSMTGSFADDIKDITLPPEMQWIRDESMIIKTESFRGGIYRYSGRVEVLSLKDYMVASMQDNRWRLVGETASKDFMLAFVKPNKTCMMVVSEKAFGKVELTLYVTIDQAGSGKINAFGEPNKW